MVSLEIAGWSRRARETVEAESFNTRDNCPMEMLVVFFFKIISIVASANLQRNDYLRALPAPQFAIRNNKFIKTRSLSVWARSSRPWMTIAWQPHRSLAASWMASCYPVFPFCRRLRKPCERQRAGIPRSPVWIIQWSMPMHSRTMVVTSATRPVCSGLEALR